jgi:hypothetical protein
VYGGSGGLWFHVVKRLLQFHLKMLLDVNGTVAAAGGDFEPVAQLFHGHRAGIEALQIQTYIKYQIQYSDISY